MAREITTTGSKLVSTLMKEFNSNFPYLRLMICPPESKALVAKGETIYGVDKTKKLSEVRTKKGGGEISFTGSKNVGTIEREFENIFGLYAQICYTTKEGKRHYTTGSGDKKSLTELNREKAAEGCQKDQWD
jgi:hypothetical protein